ncbi:hypothetical protein DFH07DRAFT_779473 [Mycena maculata]|uniref:Uncharacterized protein n=1 Tax=Mycena maculata TaxID=230809 RepID=A0AAD7MXR8_9AGAR|nr:hypothetical protein DFH07DRAFT_779473 [Mycena maculata]
MADTGAAQDCEGNIGKRAKSTSSAVVLSASSSGRVRTVPERSNGPTTTLLIQPDNMSAVPAQSGNVPTFAGLSMPEVFSPQATCDSALSLWSEPGLATGASSGRVYPAFLSDSGFGFTTLMDLFSLVAPDVSVSPAADVGNTNFSTFNNSFFNLSSGVDTLIPSGTAVGDHIQNFFASLDGTSDFFPDVVTAGKSDQLPLLPSPQSESPLSLSVSKSKNSTAPGPRASSFLTGS